MELNLTVSPDIRNKAKWLSKNLGGKWQYTGGVACCRQWEDDRGRCVRYTAPAVDEWDNPVGTSQCWIDEKGKPTKPFYWSKL